MDKREKTFTYDYDKAKEKDWDKYNESLVNILTEQKAFSFIERHGRNVDTLNKIWDILMMAIQQAANKYIPKKLVGNVKNRTLPKDTTIEDTKRERRDLLKLRKIARRLHKKDFNMDDCETFNKEIIGFNKRYQEDVSTTDADMDVMTWLTNLRPYIKRFRKLIKLKDDIKQEETIRT